MSLCVDSTRCVLARQPEVLAASPRVRRAFSLRCERLRQPEAQHTLPVQSAFSLRSERPGSQRFARVLSVCGVPFPSAASGPGSQRFGALSTGAPCLFPPRPQRAASPQEVFR